MAMGFLIIIGLPLFFIAKVVENIGGITTIIVVLLIISAVVWMKHQAKQKRLAYLRGKYANEDIVQRIFHGQIWQGQTSEQLLDSIGSPVDTDRKVLKTKSKETWKYHPRGANRYALRITVEDGIVVGWDKKS